MTAADDHAALLAQLRRPGACAGHPDGAGLVQTHISSLLLSGGQVYKLMRPVALPFVDFSSLDRRRAACDEALRLNRRTAPHWYQAVVPVIGADGGACIPAAGRPRPAGPVLDWALQMRRFDDRQLFSRLAARGELGPQQIDALAGVLADFHTSLLPSPPAFGDPAELQATAALNLQELAALLASPRWHGRPGAGQAATEVARLQAWTARRGAELTGCMQRRREAGQVRECHGDLHLANLVWADGAPVLFDALEFDPALRHIDLVGDLAFTCMDLLAADLPALAWRLASAWLEATGQHDGLPLLVWWMVHRAAVRAKVALLSAPAEAPGASSGDSPDTRSASLPGGLQRYLSVATALAAPPARPPWLVLTCGLSGSGKTVVAGALAERLGGIRLRSDVERKRLAGLPPTARGGPDLYTPQAGAATYARLQQLAADALAAGVPVVVGRRQPAGGRAPGHAGGGPGLRCRLPRAGVHGAAAGAGRAGAGAPGRRHRCLGCHAGPARPAGDLGAMARARRCRPHPVAGHRRAAGRGAGARAIPGTLTRRLPPRGGRRGKSPPPVSRLRPACCVVRQRVSPRGPHAHRQECPPCPSPIPGVRPFWPPAWR